MWPKAVTENQCGERGVVLSYQGWGIRRGLHPHQKIFKLLLETGAFWYLL